MHTTITYDREIRRQVVSCTCGYFVESPTDDLAFAERLERIHQRVDHRAACDYPTPEVFSGGTPVRYRVLAECACGYRTEEQAATLPEAEDLRAHLHLQITHHPPVI